MTKQNEFDEAIEKNNITKIESLLKDKTVDPANNNNAIRHAAKNGYLEIFKLLLNDPRSDPSDKHNYAIILASKNGHTDIVQLLLNDTRVDPSEFNNNSILLSFRDDHTDIVKLLWDDKRVKNTLQNDNINLYNTLKKQEIKKKVSEF